MEKTKESALAKLIFWQGLTAILFTLFCCIFLGFMIYDIILGLYNYNLYGFYYVVICLLSFYGAYLLYKSLRFFKVYQRDQEPLDLELAFKKQRHFWMIVPLLFSLSIIFAVGSFLFLIFSSL